MKKRVRGRDKKEERPLKKEEDMGDRIEILRVRDPLEKLKGSARIRISAEELDELAQKVASKELLK